MNIMQTKPLRSYGVDVTYNSLQPILDSLGIDEQVKNLSQAEKEILRYLATLKQAKVAMGDFANNLESPSNGLKIFKQQLVEAKVALSSLFIGTFAKILPYANAFLMVIKEVSSAIATMFGIELTDYNTGIASQEGIYDGIADSVDNATDSVKELKRQTLGFDEIHNINENKDSGSGTDVSGGIDQRLLDAITGYDNGMDKVKMKAAEIRDRIMEWLGFTKEIDPLTGDVSFKLGEGKTRFSAIVDFAKILKDIISVIIDNLDVFITVIAGYKILTWLGNVYNKLKPIEEIISGIGKSPILTGASKVTIAVVGATALGQLVSKTDWYQNLTGNQGTMFDMWGKSVEGMKVLSDKNNYEGHGSLLKNLATIDYFKMQGLDKTRTNDWESLNKSFEENLKRYYNTYLFPQEYTNGINFWELKNNYDYEKSFGEFKNKIFEEYMQDPLKYLNELAGNDFLNNDNAVNITTYTDAIKTYFDTITDGYAVLDGYSEKIQNNNEAYTNASISLGDLLTKLTNADYEPTAEEIERINSLFKEMGQISDDTAEANYQAVLKIIGNLNEHGYASDELTQKIMDNAFRQKEAQQGATREQIEAMLELQKQLQNGSITQEEYNKQVIELVKNYDQSNLIVGKAIITFDTLTKSVDITASSYEEAKGTVDEFTSAHESATESIKSGTQEQIDVLIEQMATLDRTTEEGKLAYENYAEAISLLKAKEIEDTKKVDDQYAISLANMLQTLVNSGDEQTDEVKALKKQLNDELAKIGKDVDLNANVEEINNQLGKITGKKDVYVTVHAEEDSSSFSRLRSVFSRLTGGLFSFGGGSGGGYRANANGGIYSNGSWKNIPQYANGGMPPHGSMFIAGERGAEIVGHINGRTEVLNQSQIASAIYSAVYSAMSQFSGQSSEIEVHVHSDDGVVVDKINQKTRQTGVCPINIPTY